MKPAEEKSCTAFEFPKSNDGTKVSRSRGMILHTHPKSTPSKWDDAQKWLAGLSGGGSHSHSKANKPRNSNADDRRLLNSASQRERYSCSSAEGLVMEDMGLTLSLQDESETKKIDCNGSPWKVNKPVNDSSLAVRSVCVRDMGTEMTPTASLEPSRTPTPIRASTPVLSPMPSRSSTPGRGRQVSQPSDNYQQMIKNSESDGEVVFYGVATGNGVSTRGNRELCEYKNMENSIPKQVSDPGSLESRAMAWDEAERAKYIARYRREEVKIQAWENNEKRKAETEMRRKEVKAEKMKTRAEAKLANKLAETQRIAEEKRTIAETKLKNQASKTAERADYIRRTGHLPSSFFSFKLPSLCGRKNCKNVIKN